MANQEQLQLLQQGVEVWNNWRVENQCTVIDLTDADLQNTDLSRVNFRDANLTCVNFDEAKLCEANFYNTDIRGASFKKSELQRAELSETRSGLKSSRRLLLLSLTLVISLISGSLIGSAGCRLNTAFGFDFINKTGNISSLTSLIVHVIFLLLLIFAVDEVTGLWFLGTTSALAALGVGIFTANMTASASVVVSILVAAVGIILINFSARVSICLARERVFYLNIVISTVSAFLASYPETSLGFLAAMLSCLSAHLAHKKLHKDHSYSLLDNISILFSSLGGTNFSGANLSDANFTQANIANTLFKETILCRTRWFHTKKLYLSYMVGTYLETPKVRRLLTTYRVQGTDYQKLDLRFTNLRAAQLDNADFTETTFDGANLQDSKLLNSNLRQARFDGTVLTGSYLTGACVEDWRINSDTKLDNVTCEYVYLKENEKERRPSAKEKNFAPGEFTKLFQRALNTVDLIFADGIVWRAFLQAYEDFRAQHNDEEIAIQAIEKKSGGSFIIRLEVPAEVDKAEIERAITEKYETEFEKLKAEYQTQLRIQEEGFEREKADIKAEYQTQLQRQEVESANSISTSMLEITKFLAQSRMEIKVVAESKSGDTYSGNVRAANFAPHGTASGGVFNDFSNTQDLAEAASQIQSLLSQLQEQGETSESAQQRVAENLAQQAKDSTTVKKKLEMWGQKLGDATVTDVVKGIVKMALRSSGLPLP